MFRLLRRLVMLMLFLGALAALLVFVGLPWAESRAASQIGDEIGAKVSVHAANAFSTRLVHGDLGDLEIDAASLPRGGLVLRDVAARVVNAHVDAGGLLHGGLTVSFDRIVLRARLGEAELTRFLQGRLRAVGGAPADLRVRVAGGGVRVSSHGRTTVLAVRVLAPDSLRVQVVSGAGPVAARLRRALAGPVRVGPLPWGAHVRAVLVGPTRVTLVAARGAGSHSLT
jgi:hypothetical protein